MKLFTVLTYLRRYFETNDLANGLYYDKYTFEQKSKRYLYVTIYKENGKELTLIHKKARMLEDFTKESLIDFLSNELAFAEKKKIVENIKKLNDLEIKFLKRFSKKYNRFIAELPTVII